jgi:hypothetical protein
MSILENKNLLTCNMVWGCQGGETRVLPNFQSLKISFSKVNIECSTLDCLLLYNSHLEIQVSKRDFKFASSHLEDLNMK